MQPSPGHPAAVPARPDRSRHLTRRPRTDAARMRAIAWKLVKPPGEECINGLAD
ncbi:hypothetical protein ACF1BE_28925 [Streptomyces sp. NPDC014991]|uniref:hypothetical protein n=1 Tax=Streptomyces sp. NPDC014991 TaxID=3364935 RepID=UPI0036FBD4B7